MLPSRAHCGSGASLSASSSGRLHHSSGGLCVPGLLPPLPVPCWPQPGCCPAFRVPCPVSLLQGDAKTSITSTSVPGGISSVPFAYFSS